MYASVSFPHRDNIQDHPLRQFDTARGSLDVAGKALAIVNGFVAVAARDAFRAGAALEVRVTRIVDAVTAQHFKSRLALALGVGYARTVALDETGVARAVVKIAVARATGDLARMGGARIVGARGASRHTFAIVLVESTFALTVIKALDARASRDGHGVGWTRKVGAARYALPVDHCVPLVALAITNSVIAASARNAIRVGRASEVVLAIRHTGTIDKLETWLASVLYIRHALFVLFLVAHVTLAIIEIVVA
jgi:hypothetical protein